MFPIDSMSIRNSDTGRTTWPCGGMEQHLYTVCISATSNVVYQRKRTDNTFFPPAPSTTFPVRRSTTLAWKSAPRTLSKTLPNVPQIVKAITQLARSRMPPSQNGISPAAVTETMNAPSTPASRPVLETPPLVPGDTTRRVGEVISLGGDLERMPSSEEKVSAATAA